MRTTNDLVTEVQKRFPRIDDFWDVYNPETGDVMITTRTEWEARQLAAQTNNLDWRRAAQTDNMDWAVANWIFGGRND